MARRKVKFREDIIYFEDSDYPLQTCEQSSEILALLLMHPKSAFTSKNVQDLINQKYRANLSFKRVKHILDILTERGRVSRIRQTIPGTLAPVYLYRIIQDQPSILYNSPAYRILKKIETLKNEAHPLLIPIEPGRNGRESKK